MTLELRLGFDLHLELGLGGAVTNLCFLEI